MGRRGPPPTPTAILEARGSWRAKTRPNEPAPLSRAPDAPRKLTKEARTIWKALVKLIPPGVLTRDNGQAFARYCHMLARWWKLAAWLEKNEETYESTDKAGNVIHRRHPNVLTYAELNTALLRDEQEFGLTPSARSRVHLMISSSQAPAASDPTPAAKPPPALRIAQ